MSEPELNIARKLNWLETELRTTLIQLLRRPVGKANSMCEQAEDVTKEMGALQIKQ